MRTWHPKICLAIKVLCSILLLLIASSPASFAAEPQAEVPSALKLSIGWSIWLPTYTVELKDGVLHYSESKSGKETKAEITPTPEQWAAFRQALDACDVWTWRNTTSLKTDQQGWSVTIIYKDRKIDRSGVEKAPGRKATPTGGTVEFEEYKKAVRALLGGKRFE